MSNTISGMQQSQSPCDLYQRESLHPNLQHKLDLATQQSNALVQPSKHLPLETPELLAGEAMAVLFATMDPNASATTAGRMIQQAIEGAASLVGKGAGQGIKALCQTIESENFVPNEGKLPEGYSDSEVVKFGPPGILV